MEEILGNGSSAKQYGVKKLGSIETRDANDIDRDTPEDTSRLRKGRTAAIRHERQKLNRKKPAARNRAAPRTMHLRRGSSESAGAKKK